MTALTPADVAVVRRLLAHAKAEEWIRAPVDVTESMDDDWHARYYNHNWDAHICRIGLTVIRDMDEPASDEVCVTTFDSSPGVGIGAAESAQQVADLLGVIGLVPVEMTSGWLAHEVNV